MKTRLFILAAAACFTLAACDPKEEPVPTPKSTECKITKFTALADGLTLEGFIDQAEKTIEIAYMPNEYSALTAATAEVTISELATIDPDPTVATDYTVAGGVKFTVTAEDGETTTEYTVVLAAAEFSEKVNLMWTKTYGEMGLGTTTNQCCIGFSGKDIVFSTGDVYDLNGNKLGKLNMEGVPADLTPYNGQLGSMSNDVNGVLVALACYGGENESANVCTNVYAWIDGWNSKPTLIYGPTDHYQCYYMSVAGDVKGDFVLNFRTGVSAPPQMHHVLVYKGGDYANPTWYGPRIEHGSNDGCWGQQLSFFTGNPDDGFVCWDSAGWQEHDPENANSNASSAFYVYNEGLTAFNMGIAEETILYGGVNWINWDSDGRFFGYGNYSTGHARAFVYNGQKYVIACSSSWPCNWVTIQRASNIVEDDLATDEVDESEVNYLLKTQRIDNAAACWPCSAYVYDPATGTGHVVVAAQSAAVLAYDIVTERL